jgi:hypothetical protein
MCLWIKPMRKLRERSRKCEGGDGILTAWFIKAPARVNRLIRATSPMERQTRCENG